MAHPKWKTSKSRKRKRRTHHQADVPQIATCKNTGEKHIYHQAYKVGDDLYYRGQVLVKGAEEEI
ncbi:MAG: 50S ribosomal protein L32 [Saprospiraceae bacterium]